MKNRKTKSRFLSNDAAKAKGSIKESLIETGKDLAFGLGGAAAGAFVGRPSLLIGIITSAAGFYLNNRLLTIAGIGMSASNGFDLVAGTSLNGMDGVDVKTEINNGKSRLKNFGKALEKKVYLDKFYPASTSSNPAPVASTTPQMAGLQAPAHYYTPKRALAGFSGMGYTPVDASSFQSKQQETYRPVTPEAPFASRRLNEQSAGNFRKAGRFITADGREVMI